MREQATGVPSAMHALYLGGGEASDGGEWAMGSEQKPGKTT